MIEPELALGDERLARRQADRPVSHARGSRPRRYGDRVCGHGQHSGARSRSKRFRRNTHAIRCGASASRAKRGKRGVCSHPAIATVFSLDEIDGELYIISELVRGRTLREELRDGPLPPDQLLPNTDLHRRSARRGSRKGHRPSRSETREHHARATTGRSKCWTSDSHVRPCNVNRRYDRGRDPSSARPGYMAPEQLTPGGRD